MQFQPITYSDLEEIKRLQPEGWADIIPDFEYYIKSDFCYPIKTTIDNKIAGVGVSIVFENTGWLAHIIVDPANRKQGIGFRIVEELLRNLQSKPIDSCLLLATELGQPVYTKSGFRVVTEYAYFKRDKPWAEKPVSKNIVGFSEEYRSQVYELDKAISGENRQRLLADRLETSSVYLNDGKIDGIYIPKLKEGLIFAYSDEAGIELMKMKYAKADKAVLPSDNITGIGFLKQNGFTEADTKGNRMVLGKDVDWQPEKIYSRIAGNFG
jgi:GNAT superfamily N-acetyltransferase